MPAPRRAAASASSHASRSSNCPGSINAVGHVLVGGEGQRRAWPVGEHEGDAPCPAATPLPGTQRAQVRALARHADRDACVIPGRAALRLPHSGHRAPLPARTSPISHASIPCPASNSSATGTAAGSSTTAKPMPQLNVARSSVLDMPAARATRSKSTGWGHAAGRTSTPRSSPTARGRLRAMPPPVTWASPPRRICRRRSSATRSTTAGAYSRVGVSSSSSSGSRPSSMRRRIEREAVRVQARARQADDLSPARAASAVDQLVALHEADAEAGQVELVLGHQPGMLGGLAADQRRSRSPRTRRQCHSRVSPRDPDRAGQRPGSPGSGPAARRGRRRRRRTSRPGPGRSCRAGPAGARCRSWCPRRPSRSR